WIIQAIGYRFGRQVNKVYTFIVKDLDHLSILPVTFFLPRHFDTTPVNHFPGTQQQVTGIVGKEEFRIFIGNANKATADIRNLWLSGIRQITWTAGHRYVTRPDDTV